MRKWSCLIAVLVTGAICVGLMLADRNARERVLIEGVANVNKVYGPQGFRVESWNVLSRSAISFLITRPSRYQYGSDGGLFVLFRAGRGFAGVPVVAAGRLDELSEKDFFFENTPK
ncbi:MAG: hypothetical protein JNJ45_05825 [Chthonomonas sp.]|nr:hypothetical protein [Chthonomonas sp.]